MILSLVSYIRLHQTTNIGAHLDVDFLIFFWFLTSSLKLQTMACAPNVAHQFNLPCLPPTTDGALSINNILSNGSCNNSNSNVESSPTQAQSFSICNGHLVKERDHSSSCNGHAHVTKDSKDLVISNHGHVNGGFKDVTSNGHGHVINMEKDTDGVISSKVLIIGATGFIGRYVAEASVKSGHPTYALVRPTTSKHKLVQALTDSGVHILHGCLEDYNSLVKAIRQVDIVVSTVGGVQILDQLRIIDAIKEVGATVKRFLPSEFGHDVDQADPEEPALAFYIEKRKIRRAVEEAMIPYTYICCNSIAGWPYYYHTHPTDLPPPSDRFEIYGDGNVKAYFVTGEDIGTYTMKSVDDPRTLNKSLHFRPPKNFLTLNEMASIWETKINKTLPRVVITEEDLLLIAKANFMPSSIVAALTHDIFINGCQFKFPIIEPQDVEACELYPDYKYTSIEDFFNRYL